MTEVVDPNCRGFDDNCTDVEYIGDATTHCMMMNSKRYCSN